MSHAYLRTKHQAWLISGGKSSSREQKWREIYEQSKPHHKFETDPDVHLLASETSIKIEEIRELERRLSLKPYGTPPKVAIMAKAEKLTFEAQGALLKLLEEPPGETILILETQDETNLLPTIVSRCQQVYLGPETELVLKKEEIAELKLMLDKIMNASAGERLKLAEKMSRREEAILFCQKQLVFWREILLAKPTRENAQVLREIQKTLKYLAANVNPRLAIENLLLSYST